MADATHKARYDAQDWRRGFAVALALLLCARLLALAWNATDLFYDEAQYWDWSRSADFGYYSKPPLIAWLIGLSTAICGASEFCVRLPAPILHALTAIAIFALGQRLYDVRTGALAGLVYATLPGVSVSSSLMSTDVPLLLAWAVAMWAFVALVGPGPSQPRKWWPCVVLGLAVGIGLNAKYAMAWFVVCAAVYFVATPASRWLLRDARLWSALALGGLLLLPNLAWNLANGFATFAHTADNANWQGDLFRPEKALAFVGAQFGVFGPFLFAGLLVVVWRALRARLPEQDRLLLAFALPVLVFITAQAFVSRAHANWAAVSYVAASVLLVATLVRDGSWGWLKASLGLNALVLVAMMAATTLAGRMALPVVGDPMARALGWRAIAEATRAQLEVARGDGRPFGAIVTDTRDMAASLSYYLRDEPTPLLAWQHGQHARNHFELTRPLRTGVREPILLVTRMGERSPVPTGFAVNRLLGQVAVSAGRKGRRIITFIALAGRQAKRVAAASGHDR